jgi:hypothetical protein
MMTLHFVVLAFEKNYHHLSIVRFLSKCHPDSIDQPCSVFRRDNKSVDEQVFDLEKVNLE